MRVLFLDQNKWIDIARVAKGNFPLEPLRSVYERLCEDVERGSIIAPLTVSHIIETAKRNDVLSRMDVANVQARLSKGFVYRSRKARLLVEIRNALHIAFGESPPALPADWAIVPGFMQAFEPFDTLVATPDDARTSRLINQYIDPVYQYLNYMQHQDDERRREAVKAFSAESDALLARIEGRRALMAGSSVDMRYRAYAARLFLDHQGFVAHMLEVIGHTVEEMKALGSETIVQFVRNVPTLNVEAEIVARLESQTRPLDVNDIRDTLSFYTAIPYSDRLVAEKNFTSLARQAKLQEKYNVTLHEKLEELQCLWP
jgi:hypothetical protein